MRIEKLVALTGQLALCLSSMLVSAQSWCAQSPRDMYDFLFPVPRYALVVGNRNYADGRIDPVINAHNDADEMAGKLLKSDFDVVSLKNAQFAELYAEIEKLRTRVVRAATNRGVKPLIFVYYSGHGFNDGAAGFITGVDARPDDPIQKSLAIDTIIEDLRDATLVLLIDACRTDAKTLKTGGPPGKSLWLGYDGYEGLKNLGGKPPPVPSSGSLAPRRFLIGYAALRAGDIALNEASQPTPMSGPPTSPYTTGLKQHLASSGDELRDELLDVQTLVVKITQGRQEPTVVHDAGKVYLLHTDSALEAMRREWERARDSGSVEEITRYMNRYPASPYYAAGSQWLADHAANRIAGR